MKYKLTCPDCNSPMLLRNSKYGKFYGCSTFPKCRATHGAHPNGSPLGIPATKEVKELRMKAHKIAGKIWGEWDDYDCDKKSMYEWLARNTVSGHFAKMERDELIDVIAKMDTLNKIEED